MLSAVEFVWLRADLLHKEGKTPHNQAHVFIVRLAVGEHVQEAQEVGSVGEEGAGWNSSALCENFRRIDP